MKLHIENSIVIENNGRTTTLGKGEYEFDSASEFIKFVEGLGEQPKQPYIKDEKIRKAVRAWADVVGTDKCTYDRFWETLRSMDTSISFAGVYQFELEDEENYTIAELCGEEEQ